MDFKNKKNKPSKTELIAGTGIWMAIIVFFSVVIWITVRILILIY